MKLTIIHRSRGFYDVLQEDKGKIIYKKPQRLNIKKILLNCNRISWVTTAYTKRKGDFLRCLKQR